MRNVIVFLFVLLLIAGCSDSRLSQEEEKAIREFEQQYKNSAKGGYIYVEDGCWASP